jgi:hypothetical protein
VPALVAELVARGASIHAVVPTRHTLEERFMSLLRTRHDDPAEVAASDDEGGSPLEAGS